MKQGIFSGVDLTDQKWNPKQCHAQCGLYLIGCAALLDCRGKHFHGLVEFTAPVKKEREMVRSNFGQFSIVPVALPIRVLQMNQRTLVVFGFKFRQSQKSQRRAHLRTQRNQALQGRDGFGVMVPIVVQRTQVPPALGPIRLQFERALVEANGIIHASAFAGGCGLCGELLERSAGIAEGRALLSTSRA